MHCRPRSRRAPPMTLAKVFTDHPRILLAHHTHRFWTSERGISPLLCLLKAAPCILTGDEKEQKKNEKRCFFETEWAQSSVSHAQGLRVLGRSVVGIMASRARQCWFDWIIFPCLGWMPSWQICSDSRIGEINLRIDCSRKFWKNDLNIDRFWSFVSANSQGQAWIMYKGTPVDSCVVSCVERIVFRNMWIDEAIWIRFYVDYFNKNAFNTPWNLYLVTSFFLLGYLYHTEWPVSLCAYILKSWPDFLCLCEIA